MLQTNLPSLALLTLALLRCYMYCARILGDTSNPNFVGFDKLATATTKGIAVDIVCHAVASKGAELN